MSNTPPSDPVSLRVQTNLGKKKSDGKSEEGQGNVSKVVNGNTGEVAGSAAGPFAGEMERRGEEKLLDERIRERYQREIGDIFDESHWK